MARIARKYEVLISFDGMSMGDQFTANDQGYREWADGHVVGGYLRDVTEDVPEREQDAGRGEVGKG